MPSSSRSYAYSTFAGSLHSSFLGQQSFCGFFAGTSKAFQVPGASSVELCHISRCAHSAATRKPTSASLICSAVLTLQGNKSGVCRSQPSASQQGLLTQVGHCTTAISQQLAFFGLKSNGLAHLFEDTASSHLQALAAGKFSEQTMCKQITAYARTSRLPLLVH